MADQPREPARVARGDRRDELWIEEDRDQFTRIRHGWPADGPVPPEMQSQVPEGEARDADQARPDLAGLVNEESAWEAREKDE